MTTRIGFDRALADLKEKLLIMGGKATEAIHQAVTSLAEQDLDLAQKVVDGDDAIDDLAYELEEDCLRLIALQQPIAKDLRAVAAAYRMTTDLERIADHAVNIAGDRVTDRPRTADQTVDRHPAHGQDGRGDGPCQPDRLRAERSGAGPAQLPARSKKSTALREPLQ